MTGSSSKTRLRSKTRSAGRHSPRNRTRRPKHGKDQQGKDVAEDAAGIPRPIGEDQIWNRRNFRRRAIRGAHPFTLARKDQLLKITSIGSLALCTALVAPLLICSSRAVIAQTAETAAISGRALVVDGDGLRIGPVTIRIHGIDAPEASQRSPTASVGSWACGAQATTHLQRLAGGRSVTCMARDRDGYGRIVASCEIDGQDLAARIVEAGLAWAYVKYSRDYARLEAAARAAGIGIWQAPAQPPWEYRADRWARAVAAAPNGCPIKGNIGTDGGRIYYTPWLPWYERTKISEAEGERWFYDEAEAQAAGWRAAKAR